MKVFKNMGWPNKVINSSKRNKSYKKWLASKKRDDKIEYKETEH
jgi:hypothetical protein